MIPITCQNRTTSVQKGAIFGLNRVDITVFCPLPAGRLGGYWLFEVWSLKKKQGMVRGRLALKRDHTWLEYAMGDSLSDQLDP